MARGRRKGNPDTRAEILAASRAEFAEKGYERATIRAIATRADVDPALVMHYFGSKEQLFAAGLEVPFSPATVLRSVFASTDGPVGEALVTAILTAWDEPGAAGPFLGVLRSATGEGPVHDLVREFLHATILESLTDLIDGPDAELRAGLAGSQMIGLLVGRYLVELEPLVDAPIPELAERVGPVIDSYVGRQ